MSLFQRMWRPLRGWLLTGVDRVEEPECVLDRAQRGILREREQHLEELFQALTLRSELRKELRRAQKQLSRLETMLRVSQRRMDETTTALHHAESQAVRNRVEALQAQLIQIEQVTEGLKARYIESEMRIRQGAAERLASSSMALEDQELAYLRAEQVAQRAVL